MSVNRYMHPRNKYRKPPDYKQLAIMYPEFREIAITDLAGKVRIDFQNKKSLRVLTETLLKHDFDLHVNIPSDNLNPALTLRMNYILWIEDLMKHSGNTEMDKITGIDIGIGAICIYALLLAKMYGCHVTGTEINKMSVETAMQCVKKNNLENLIKVIAVNPDQIFKDVVKSNEVYHFSMCNPPFFEIDSNSEKVAKILPPRNAPTGNATELKTVGGELAFVTKMIEESIELGDKIRIYTTMIGKKADLLRLKKLIKSKRIENMTWTEFCQGHITRWGLAWSFLQKDSVNLSTAPVVRKDGRSIVPPLKKNDKTLITLPMDKKFSCINDVINFLKVTAEELNIKLQHVPIPEDSFDGLVCQITATERTWEHARRKRRLAQRQIQLKKSKGEDNRGTNTECSSMVIVAEKSDQTKQIDNNFSDKILVVKDEKHIESTNDEKLNVKVPDEYAPVLKCKLCVEIESSQIKTIRQNNVFKIWMIFENGTGGLEAFQSFRQYLINKFGMRKNLFSMQKSVNKNK